MTETEEILAEIRRNHAAIDQVLAGLAGTLSELIREVGRLANETQRAVDQLADVSRVGVRKVCGTPQ